MATEQAAVGYSIYGWTSAAYYAAFIAYAVHLFFARGRNAGRLAVGILWLAVALHTIFLVQRAVFYYYQHQGFVLPATNMFEAIGFFVWLIALLYLALEYFLKTRVFGVIALIIPVAALAYTAGSSSGPRELMPSLKSYWLVFHVTAMFISYAAFALAFSFAIMYLLQVRGVRTLERVNPRFSLEFLDTVAYKLVLFGYPVLTLGIYLGAVWANEAWGRYWDWDPKETWALITWLVYLAFLHLRLQWRWVGYRSALFNIIGFAAVLITFIGVNLLDDVFKLGSLHSYAKGGAPFLLILLGLAVLIPAILYFLPVPPEERMPAADDMAEFRTAVGDQPAKEKQA